MPLEINDDITFQKKFWHIERVFWGILLLFTLAALFGVFGKGPVSETSHRQENLNITFNRFLRYGNNSKIEIILPPGSRPVIGIAKEFIDKIDSVSFTPAPERIYYANNQIRYIFMVDERQPSEIVVSFKPTARGLLKGTIEHNGIYINFSQFVYP
ncbi:MAG: hypothetical protein BWY69_00456 [Planctomycetes bacterium ADurb.Bin401]|nr:MAG: hypothetical protein BWY69_00456 [Planctomycetes bacterium ADurb.Bin401]